MKKTCAILLTLATGIVSAQEIDPGWSRRAEYIAETGDTNCNYAAVIAWEKSKRLSTPIVYDQPIQARIETPATDGHVYGIEVDPAGGELIPVQRESTRLTQAEYDANKEALLAARATHRANMAAIKTDLDQVEAALDQVDVTTTGPLGVAIAATTGVNKAALTEVRKVLVDLKAAAKNLKQATEKVRREIR